MNTLSACSTQTPPTGAAMGPGVHTARAGKARTRSVSRPKPPNPPAAAGHPERPDG